jgi:hypothetical protein
MWFNMIVSKAEGNQMIIFAIIIALLALGIMYADAKEH